MLIEVELMIHCKFDMRAEGRGGGGGLPLAIIETSIINELYSPLYDFLDSTLAEALDLEAVLGAIVFYLYKACFKGTICYLTSARVSNIGGKSKQVAVDLFFFYTVCFAFLVYFPSATLAFSK